MTREEYHEKFRGRFLLFLVEVWEARKEPPSALGMLLDKHSQELMKLLNETYDSIAHVKLPAKAVEPPQAPATSPPGKASTPLSQTPKK